MCIYRFYYLWNSFLESKEAVIKKTFFCEEELWVSLRTAVIWMPLWSCGKHTLGAWAHVEPAGSELGLTDSHLWRRVTLLPPSIYLHPTEIHDRAILSIIGIFIHVQTMKQKWTGSSNGSPVVGRDDSVLREMSPKRHREDSTTKVAGQREVEGQVTCNR